MINFSRSEAILGEQSVKNSFTLHLDVFKVKSKANYAEGYLDNRVNFHLTFDFFRPDKLLVCVCVRVCVRVCV